MDKIKLTRVSNKRLIGVVVKLAHEIWREHYPPMIGRAQVDYMLERFQSREAVTTQIHNKDLFYYLGRKKNNNFIGYFAVSFDRNTLKLSKFYLLSSERGKGYAQQMMAFLETLARRKGCSKITLSVNKKNRIAIRFYRKMGFLRIAAAKRPIGNGFLIDDYDMAKKIIPTFPSTPSK